jgi:hypothetical protein
MGWTGWPKGTTFEAVRKAETDGWGYVAHDTGDDVVSSMVVESALTREGGSQVLWLAVRQYGGRHDDRAVCTPWTETFVVCVLIDKVGGHWSTKSMTEGCHPYYYTCPESVLGAATAGTGKCHNQAWREKVREMRPALKTQRRRANR